MCDCAGYCWQADGGYVDQKVLAAPEWSGKETICVDACIADVIEALWIAGIVTRGCCCGHGKSNPDVILEHTEDVALAEKIISKLDDRSWSIYCWVLANVGGVAGK